MAATFIYLFVFFFVSSVCYFLFVAFQFRIANALTTSTIVRIYRSIYVYRVTFVCAMFLVCDALFNDIRRHLFQSKARMNRPQVLYVSTRASSTQNV